jgi:cell division protein FtsL
MLFLTVVLFVAYSIVYFVASQLKIKRLRNNIATLNSSLQEKSRMLNQAKSRRYESELVK